MSRHQDDFNDVYDRDDSPRGQNDESGNNSGGRGKQARNNPSRFGDGRQRGYRERQMRNDWRRNHDGEGDDEYSRPGGDDDYVPPSTREYQDSDSYSPYRDSKALGTSYRGGRSQHRGYSDRPRDFEYRDDEDERGFLDRASDEVQSWFGDDDAQRRRQQDHRGRGPKNYQRSDGRIEEDVNDRLTNDSRIDASDVTVEVTDCEVTLDGFVPSRGMKRFAEDCAESVSGVKHVQNNLRVRDRSQNETSETAASGLASVSEGTQKSAV